jgi:GTP-sensing pleiotropic transcriptional regulator CodY
MTLNYEEIVRRFQGLVQGNIDLKKSKNKLEGYSMKMKMIMNQNQTIKQLKRHMIKNLKGCTNSNRRQDNCGGLLPLCLSANGMAPQR